MLMVGALLRFGSIAAWILQIIVQMGGCLGCYNKPKLNSPLNEPLKGQNINTCAASTATIFENYWTTSTCEIDSRSAQSRGSISSTSTLTQMHDAHGAGSSIKPTEFVNHGLLLWNQSRQKWTGNKKSDSPAQQPREPKLTWNATYDSLLSSNKPFTKPIPLGEMVDFLVDIWEQEGMYD